MKLNRVFILLLVVSAFNISIVSTAKGSEGSAGSSIQQLIADGRIKADILGTGGHEGECITMLLSNLAADTTFVRVEPGRILQSVDTSIQDILITREEMLALAPGERRNISIYGFCGQADNASPDSSELFSIGQMADSSIVALAEFLNGRNNEFPQDAIQHAVWCLTDEYDVNDIYSSDLASIADLRNFVAELKGVDPLPLEIQDVPYDGGMFTHYTKTISGEVELHIPRDCIVDIAICDKDGKQYDSFEKQIPYKAGTYSYSFRFTATNWPPGKYYFTIRGDGKLLFEKVFEL